jgi:FkbM family methyltransferase
MLLKEVGKMKAHIIRMAGYEPDRNLEPQQNGEYRFLAWLSTLPEIDAFDSVIDVGANNGEWTEAARAALGDGKISNFYCIEPIPWLADTVKKRFSSSSAVEVFEIALSNNSGGEVTIYNSGGGGTMYRSYRGNDIASDKSEKKIIEFKVKQQRGDDLFMPSPSRPYLIKIDCDGHDYKVLAGFSGLLAHKRPIVQFEYCDFWIASNSRLKNACAMLTKAGYATYKMFPDRLERFCFNPLFETFGYQNIVAAPREMKSFEAPTLALRGA